MTRATRTMKTIFVDADRVPRNPDHSQAPARISSAMTTSATADGMTNKTSSSAVSATKAVSMRCFST